MHHSQAINSSCWTYPRQQIGPNIALLTRNETKKGKKEKSKAR